MVGMNQNKHICELNFAYRLPGYNLMARELGKGQIQKGS